MTEQKSRANKHLADKIKSNGHAVSAKRFLGSPRLSGALFPTSELSRGAARSLSHIPHLHLSSASTVHEHGLTTSMSIPRRVSQNLTGVSKLGSTSEM